MDELNASAAQRQSALESQLVLASQAGSDAAAQLAEKLAEAEAAAQRVFSASLHTTPNYTTP